MELQQLFLNRVVARFNLREPKGCKPTNIYMVVRSQGKQYKFPIGCKVYPAQWDKRKQCAFISPNLSELDNRNNVITNNRIADYTYLMNQLKQYLYQNPDEIKNYVTHLRKKLHSEDIKRGDQSNALIDMIGLVDEQAMGEASKSHFRNEAKMFGKFVKEKYDKTILHWDEITLALLTEYESWLHQKTIIHGGQSRGQVFD